jgi:hypothetical protein
MSDQRANSISYSQIPYAKEQGISKCVSGNFLRETGKFSQAISKRPFLAHLFRRLPNAICSALNFADEENKMADEILTRTRYGEAFWPGAP